MLESVNGLLRASYCVSHARDGFPSLLDSLFAFLGDSIIIDQASLPLLRLTSLAFQSLFVILSLGAQEVLHVVESALRVIAVVNFFFLQLIISACKPCLELSIAFV